MIKKESNYQDFLKVIAIVTMVIDHLGMYFFPEYQIMRVIGRITMPIFCFAAGYNFHGKPRIKLLIIGVLLQIFTTILLKPIIIPNILLSIFLGQCYIYYFQNSLNKFFYKGYSHVILIGSLWFCTYFFLDYGTISTTIVLLGYIARHDSVNFRLCVSISIILTIIHSYVTAHFSYTYLIAFGIVEYILMGIRNFDQKTAINWRIISRNSLYIYAGHVAMFQFIFAKLYGNLQ